jgi:hypothetical protein
MLVDQRVRELPLGAGELDPVPLDRGGRRARRAELLPLGDEVGDAGSENVYGRAVPAAPEARRTQRPKCRAASHAPSIGTQTMEV